jgi:chromosome condensin MukBEF complex kleisin-like MukF subunit
MACYVDSVRSYPEAGLRFTEFCHLLADTREELHALADELGIPRRFFQDHPWRWHYDVPRHLRDRAVELGAVEVDMHRVGTLLRARKAALSA